MVKHIVLFKLKDEVPEAEKLVVMNKFKEAIEALPAKISVIRKIEVGLNMNPGEAWHIALYSESKGQSFMRGLLIITPNNENEKINFFSAFKLCSLYIAGAD